MAPGADFLPEICKLKHENIDKDINNLEEDIEEIKKSEQDQHEEIKSMIEGLSNEVKISHHNLKNKIVLVNKSMGDKIDELHNFDKKLRGNGNPGIWESFRNMKRDVRVIMILLIIFIGGSVGGLSLKTIRDRMFGVDQNKTKQIQPTPEPPPKIITPKK